MWWFTLSWWKYLLATPAEGIGICTAFLCRVKGHKSGVIWVNAGGDEPDMHCKNCYDDLG